MAKTTFLLNYKEKNKSNLNLKEIKKILAGTQTFTKTREERDQDYSTQRFNFLNAQKNNGQSISMGTGTFTEVSKEHGDLDKPGGRFSVFTSNQ
jgi:hypothetical protein